jgi:hypothetical protein
MSKRYLSFAILIAISTIAILAGCRNTKGDPGPTGPAGATGLDLPRYKAGSISGTVTGTSALTATAISIPFDYTYFKEVLENSVYTDANGAKHYTIQRYDSIADSYFLLSFWVDGQGVFNGTSATIKIVEKDATGNHFYFGTGTDPLAPTSISLNSFYTYESSAITFDNTSYNASTNAVSFDYTIELYNTHNTTGNMATITGSVNVAPFTQSFRIASEQ